MKKVFSSTDDVAAVWAADTQAEGRTPNRKWRFSNGVIRHYGHAMGVLFRGPNGQRFALIEELSSLGTARRAAAEKGATLIILRNINDFESMHAKVAKRDLSELRKHLEQDIATRLAEINGYEEFSWVQSSRLKIIAEKIRAHQVLASAFGLDWPPQASVEAFEARSNAASQATQNKSEQERRKRLEESRKRDRVIAREKREAVEPEREIELWLRSERLSLQHQPAAQPHEMYRIRFRVRDGQVETSDDRSLSMREFSKMFAAAVSAAAELEDNNEHPEWFDVGGLSYRVTAGGDLHGWTRNWRNVIYFADLMACVEAGAPRLHAKALRKLHPEQEAAPAP